MLLTEKCAQILGCRISDLRDRLNHPNDRAIVLSNLNGKLVQTTYLDRNGFNKTFAIGGLSTTGADTTMAYGCLRGPFNVCVAAHFYVRHRIKLRHPYLHCVVERFPEGQEDRFYPLELCKLVVPMGGLWFGNMFKELDNNKEKKESVDMDMCSDETMRAEEFDEDEGREECSQKMLW